MKILIAALFFALVKCQRPTVSEDLLAAQAELTVGHEFTEIYLVQNREVLSGYLTRIETVNLFFN